MNQYPKWKYGLVLIAIFIGLIYSVPNFFGESPAVQIMPTKASDKLDLSILATIESALKEANRLSQQNNTERYLVVQVVGSSDWAV